MSEEETPVKKEEEIFGFKKGDLTALGTVLALGGIGYLIWDKFKQGLPQPQPQAQAQPQLQPTGYTPEQIQQIQAQQAQAQQVEAQKQQQQQEPVQYGYATEQDPMSGKVIRQRVREIESTDPSLDRFSSISV